MKPSRKRTRRQHKLQEDKIYLDGRVVETFPGAVFGIEVVRKNNLPPLLIKCQLKAALIKRKVLIIKGDLVNIEINPEDLSTEDQAIRGIIIERKQG